MGGPKSIPAITHGEDILIAQGDNVTIVTWTAASDEQARLASVWQRILASLKVQ